MFEWDHNRCIIFLIVVIFTPGKISWVWYTPMQGKVSHFSKYSLFPSLFIDFPNIALLQCTTQTIFSIKYLNPTNGSKIHRHANHYQIVFFFSIEFPWNLYYVHIHLNNLNDLSWIIQISYVKSAHYKLKDIYHVL